MTPPRQGSGGQAAPDPGAIDLELYRQRLRARYPDEDNPIEDNDDDVGDLIAAVEALRAQLGEQDGPCYYCGQPTNSWAGNPSKWPLMFCHKEEPGVSKHHHVGCMTKKLASAEAAEARVAEMEGALGRLLEFADRTGQGCAKQVEDARATLASRPPRRRLKQ